MAGDRLTERERRTLQDIEDRLNGDRALRHRVGLLAVRQRLAAQLVRGRALALCAVLSLALLVLGGVTASPVAIWAFVVCWPLTVAVAVLILRRAVRDHPGPPRPFV
ncbi:DUF3040 domain-containing protein [Streptomyces sp. NPDC059578]|uniref:DUF3040 domain-containing protein n=1 Tax=unclassified Streptomyces TaxID=2593676 RepID=UPI00365B4A77